MAFYFGVKEIKHLLVLVNNQLQGSNSNFFPLKSTSTSVLFLTDSTYSYFAQCKLLLKDP